MKEKITIVNPDDYNNRFWKKNYLIRVTYPGTPFIVNADNEQEAIDYFINYCEEHYPGLVSTYQELIDDGYTDIEIDELISGGNHGLYLTIDGVISIEVMEE
jgi:hypothetical protein